MEETLEVRAMAPSTPAAHPHPALRRTFIAILVAALLFYAYKTIHWQVMWDPAVMHYVNFLMNHGLAPYRDIIDINLPGSFFLDGWIMSVFGSGDLAFRMYEFCLLAVFIGSMCVIALPYDWLAGLAAGVLFTMRHAVEGPRNAGQREELMTTLIMVGFACLFSAFRHRKPWLMVPFGISIGLATTLKPTACVLLVALPWMGLVALRKEGLQVKKYLGHALLGAVLSLLPSIWFFWHYHCFYDFIAVSRRLVTFYASVGNASIGHMFYALVHDKFLLPASALIYLNRRQAGRERFERNMLIGGVLFGAVSFLAQRKDFEHHLYVYAAFLTLLLLLEASKAWKQSGFIQGAGLAIVVCVVCVLVPRSAFLLAKTSAQTEQQDGLSNDLARLGGAQSLQKNVLCFDMVASCYTALFRMQILPYSNLVADYMLLPPAGYAPVDYYRQMLWADLQRKSPQLIVVSNMWLSMPNSFDKLHEWPDLENYLATRYVIVSSLDSGYGAYRVYQLKSAAASAGPYHAATLR